MPASEPRPFNDPLMQVINLRSDINGRDYDLRIRLPLTYGQGDRRYPVVLMLDAESIFYLASDITPIKAMWSQAPTEAKPEPVPEVIVAAVALPSDPPDLLRRNFEFQPPCSQEDFSPSNWAYMKRLEPMVGRMPEFGGAATFLEVLRDELLPAVDAAFRTDTSRRMLFGVSASGCFAAFALLTEPELFTDYAIASPGLPGCIFRIEEAWAAAHDDLSARVTISAGELELRDPFNIFSATMRLTEDLNSRGYPGLELETLIVPRASHVETVAPTLSRALSRFGGV